MSGQELVAELRLYADQAEIADNAESDFSRTQNRAADRIEALEAAVDTWTEMAARRHRALGEVEASYREAIARAERAEQKSAELAAVIAEARDHEWSAFGDSDTHRILSAAVPADVLSAYTTRIREEALACEEVEYTFSEVLDDGTVAYSSPFATLEEAAEAQAKARMNYPWPEEIGLARRRAPGPWAVIPEGEDR